LTGCFITERNKINRLSGTMATGKQLKAAMLVPRTTKGLRKKRTRPEPRQYTVVDLERARDRVAERRSAASKTTVAAIPTGDAQG
jgi:hypothetical protein